ncbi:MAG: hypothetical protein RLZZ461_822 [Planctomycetota bacterium]|jgi:hypothetical protein
MSSPSSPIDPADEHELLVHYLANRSTPCPRCRFDLRDVREPRCPECGEPIRLQVGAARPLIWWFIVAIAPGIFSGIAASILAIPMTVSLVLGLPGNIPPEIWFAESVGVVSVLLLAALLRWRWWFIARSPRRQISIAVSIWSAHALATAFLIFVL